MVFVISGDVTRRLIGGVPLNQPVVCYGPLVMKNAGEIPQAMIDYQSGRFGEMGRWCSADQRVARPEVFLLAVRAAWAFSSRTFSSKSTKKSTSLSGRASLRMT